MIFKHFYALFVLSIFSNLSSMQMQTLSEKSIYAPAKIGKIKVLTKNKAFYVQDKDGLKQLQSYNIDPLLKKCNQTQLEAFLKNGYVTVSQCDNGEYKLQAYGRIKGGGPISGWIGYWGTKALAWGTVSLAATASIKALAAKAGITAGVKTATAGAKMLIGAKGLAVTVGEEVVEAAIGEAGAKNVMGAIAAHVPGAALLATKIETTSTTVGAILGAIPWLP